ncbi:ABC transporter ATP-binding protein [Levilactobacillus namurensis]|uniref:ABC transporter ATP-binding protein n=1 Tax=Levilactobacillus namurensis TaxID=380393 RepID=UPI0026EF337E|nr:ATP-binding cassette domain-containing protein [Levilactobacillus namurensis]
MLTLRNVDTFIRHKQIIKQATFTINPGDIVGLIGPNGAGKTTIMKTILGLTKFNGDIMVNRTSVTETDHTALTNVGALIEHPAIYPFLTGRQNLALYSRDPQDLDSLVRLLQMSGYIDAQSKGYSLGMKQKLGIAIALLNRPKLVILDEPMNGLDVEATIIIRQIIKQYAEQGTAFLISSHILSELQKVMTRIVLINNGRIILNQDSRTFKQQNLQNYTLQTEANAQVAELLQAAHIPYQTRKEHLLVSKTAIFTIQDILAAHRIYLKELAPETVSFEHLIVQILKMQRGDEHHED